MMTRGFHDQPPSNCPGGEDILFEIPESLRVQLLYPAQISEKHLDGDLALQNLPCRAQWDATELTHMRELVYNCCVGPCPMDSGEQVDVYDRAVKEGNVVMETK